MINLKLTIEFDGDGFSGWQRQPNVRTVQGEIEFSLQQFLQQPVKVVGAGRTDVGVHALGQVANVKVNTTLSLQKIKNSLNGILTPDVRIRDICEVPLEFNARFDAIAREYVYRITKRERAIGRQYMWYYKQPLAVEMMREATQVLHGQHDFRSFCKTKDEEDTYLCDLYKVIWWEDEEEIQFRIKANRFLHNMIRTIIGTAVEVGRGKMKPSEIANILANQNRGFAGPTAPAHGLCLKKVYY